MKFSTISMEFYCWLLSTAAGELRFAGFATPRLSEQSEQSVDGCQCRAVEGVCPHWMAVKVLQEG